MLIAYFFPDGILGNLGMTLIDQINIDQWEQFKNYQKHSQVPIGHPKCQLQICSWWIEVLWQNSGKHFASEPMFYLNIHIPKI